MVFSSGDRFKTLAICQTSLGSEIHTKSNSSEPARSARQAGLAYRNSWVSELTQYDTLSLSFRSAQYFGWSNGEVLAGRALVAASPNVLSLAERRMESTKDLVVFAPSPFPMIRFIIDFRREFMLDDRRELPRSDAAREPGVK